MSNNVFVHPEEIAPFSFAKGIVATAATLVLSLCGLLVLLPLCGVPAFKASFLGLIGVIVSISGAAHAPFRTARSFCETSTGLFVVTLGIIAALTLFVPGYGAGLR